MELAMGMRVLLFIILGISPLALSWARAETIGEEIYRKATPKQRCQIEVLTQKLGMKLVGGSPQAPKTYQNSGACDYLKLSDAQAAGEMSIQIQSATQFLSSLDGWMDSYPAMCGFKYRTSAVIKKSIDALHSNLKNQFVDGNGAARSACYAEGASQALVKPDSNGVFCLAAAFNAASFVECFRKGDCYADCAVGAQAAELNLMYDLYDEDGDGILQGRERDLYNQAYSPEEAVVGRWDIAPNAGLFATQSAFHGKNAKRVAFTPPATQAFTGVIFNLSAKGSYVDQVNSGQMRRPPGDLTQNGMIVSVSPAAVNEIYQNQLDQLKNPDADHQDALITTFEKKFGELRAKVLSLSYSQPDALGRPQGLRAYEQLMTKENFSAIMNGTYSLKNATPQDEKTLREIVAFLKTPVFSETEVYVQPHGRMSLAQLSLKMINYHVDANASFETYRSSMNTTQFEKYRNVYVQDCLSRK